jgi:hypothetical protein
VTAVKCGPGQPQKIALPLAGPQRKHQCKRRLRVSFCFELPNVALAELEKSLKTNEYVVGAVGIEPTTSPV